MAKREDLDKILATASSALNKREELQRILSEKDELEEKLANEELTAESVSNLIDKGILVSKKLLSFGKTDDAALLLALLLKRATELNLENLKKTLLGDMIKIVSNLIKEALVWETYNKAFLFSIIHDILINYGIDSIQVEETKDFDKYLIKIDENLERVNSALIQLKNDVTSLTVAPNKDAVRDLKNKYSDTLKQLREEKTLEIIIYLLDGLAQE
ncbi:MAG: hypothetical protein ACP6IP_01380 [Candidatus Njordarchaeia archaeon]